VPLDQLEEALEPERLLQPSVGVQAGAIVDRDFARGDDYCGNGGELRLCQLTVTKFDTIYTGTVTHPVFRDIYAPLDGFVLNGGIKVRL